ncbi:MAG: Hsp20/alpha crystallin family protein [Balneolaceae bacterium]
MALIKYNRPSTELKGFSDLIDEFFNDSMNYRRDNFMPSVDISETETEFQISAELPGMKKEDIKIDLEGGRLVISGERKLENEKDGKNFHRVESRYGQFSRAFYLPDSIDEDSINATYKDGMLNITIKKSEDKVKKQIEIH